MKQRYIPLDILRGLTVMFMCIVNNPGSWSHIFPPLAHAPWNGCTPTDLVFPTFVFCMGCAMAFSLAKYDGLTGAATAKIVKRGIAIFIVGLLLNLYIFFPTSPHDPSWSFWQNWVYWFSHKRIFGVLQRLGMVYIVAGILALWLRKPKKIAVAIAVLCIVYTAILLLFGTEPGAFTLEGNVSRRIDLAIVGDAHCYHGYSGVAFDPEGPLGTMTGTATALIGYMVGCFIRTSMRRRHAALAPEAATAAGNAPADVVAASVKAAPVPAEAVPSVPQTAEAFAEAETHSPAAISAKTYTWAGICLVIGLVLSIWIPICKALWSASYVFYAAGWSMVGLAFFAYWTDVKSHGKWFEPLIAMGTNPLVAFVTSGVLAKTIPLLGIHVSKYFGANEYTSLLHAILFMLIIFSIQWVLYKKKIVIKL